MGFGSFEAKTERTKWLPLVFVVGLHLLGIYVLATWAPRADWAKLWRPIEVRLLQDEPPPPPPLVEPEQPPPPEIKPKVIEKKVEKPVPPPEPQLVPQQKPVEPEPPLPVITAAPNAPPPVTQAPVVAPQPEPPVSVPPPAPKPATPAGPRLVSKMDFIRAPDPIYPMMSRRIGEQGKVIVRALVDEKGHAVSVSVHQSSGSSRLDEAAKEAVLKAVFKPYLEDGRPQSVFVTVPVVFTLQG
jgi:periplasmic protein TonB